MGSTTALTEAIEYRNICGSAKTKSVTRAYKVGPNPLAMRLPTRKYKAVIWARKGLGVITCKAAAGNRAAWPICSCI